MSPNNLIFDHEAGALSLQGQWRLHGISKIKKIVKHLPKFTQNTLRLNGQDLVGLDSVGCILINQIINYYESQGKIVELKNFETKFQRLINLTAEQGELTPPKPPKFPSIFYMIGKRTVGAGNTINLFLSFVGELVITIIKTLLNPTKLQWRSTIAAVELNGFRAMPIIALLSFLIGVVLTYQMGLQLRDFGANIYIVNLVGIAILREFGPLLSAIILAGRTGSAYTAEIGTMVVNEEVDALQTMGISPSEMLILPKVLGLVIALPLLTVWANLFGVLGGMVMSKVILGISFKSFLIRFKQVISLRMFWLGMVKTPYFALIISCVGCYQGLRVYRSAESVGKQTTKSVVNSIFLIIIVDALFSILFSWSNF